MQIKKEDKIQQTRKKNWSFKGGAIPIKVTSHHKIPQ